MTDRVRLHVIRSRRECNRGIEGSLNPRRKSDKVFTTSLRLFHHGLAAMTRHRFAPAVVLAAALIGTAAAQEKPAVAPAPRRVPTPVAPAPHHSLAGYIP